MNNVTQIANEAKQVAVASNAIAKQAVDDMYTQFAEKWLSEEGNASQLQRDFLEKAAAFYNADATHLVNVPTLAIDQLKLSFGALKGTTYWRFKCPRCSFV